MQVAREAGEPEEATLGVYNFYLVERAYSVRDYINSRLAPIAYSVSSSTVMTTMTFTFEQKRTRSFYILNNVCERKMPTHP